MLDQQQLARTLFPVGDSTKARLRELAGQLGLRTAHKPDSQDVCFITTGGGRTEFLGNRIPLRSARVVDTAGTPVGETEAVELVTVGQRRGLGLPGGGPKRYVVDVDTEAETVTVGSDTDLLRESVTVDRVTWVDGQVDGDVLVQSSAHGIPEPATLKVPSEEGAVIARWATPQRRVAPGQSVVFYDPTDTRVLGGGVAR